MTKRDYERLVLIKNGVLIVAPRKSKYTISHKDFIRLYNILLEKGR